MKFDELPHSEHLAAGGFNTMLRVQRATDEELLAVEGIGPAGLISVRAAFAPEEKPVGDPVETHLCSNRNCGYEINVSPCPYCGAV